MEQKRKTYDEIVQETVATIKVGNIYEDGHRSKHLLDDIKESTIRDRDSGAEVKIIAVFLKCLDHTGAPNGRKMRYPIEQFAKLIMNKHFTKVNTRQYTSYRGIKGVDKLMQG